VSNGPHILVDAHAPPSSIIPPFLVALIPLTKVMPAIIVEPLKVTIPLVIET
jgi:hypothetical protein